MAMNAALTDIRSVESYTQNILDILIDYSPRLISAILLLFIGLWITKIIGNVTRKIMVRREVEPTLVEFLSDILYWGLRVVLFIAVISKLGIESSSFVAVLGAAGLAIGLSLQGSLSNFAGGMLIILFKPFKLGDSIEAQGVSGTVIDIQIFVTQLLTGNNQVIFIPNGSLSNGTIINYSKMDMRRIDLIMGVSYESDIKAVRAIIENILKQHPKILVEPEPSVFVRDLTDSGIKIGIRAWVKNIDFSDVSAEILEFSIVAFEAKGITIQPYLKEMSKS